MFDRTLAPAAMLLVFGSLTSCGEDAKPCFRNDDCTIGYRCSVVIPGERGVCEACAETETPYDGIDNDCDPLTPDVDLDGDGDNYVNSAVDPGGDCDDTNPKASSLQVELCEDDIDNDCDGETDEDDCGDFNPPIVTIRSPRNGDDLRGTVTFDVLASDDTWVTRLEVVARDEVLVVLEVQDRTQTEFILSVDTTVLADGVQTMTVRAVDATGKRSEAGVQVRIDNETGPDIRLLSPQVGRSYGGLVEAVVDVRQPDDLVSLEFYVDEGLVHTATAAPFGFQFDSRTLPEGPLSIEVIGTDPFGDRTVVSAAFLIDNTGPSITVEPAAGSTLQGSVTFVITAEDSAGVQSVRALGRESTTSVLTIQTNASQLVNGQFQLEVTAIDSAVVDALTTGNRAVQAFSYTVVGGVNASLGWLDPLPNGDVYQGLNILRVASSGIRNLEWLVNGQAFATTVAGAGGHTLTTDLSFLEPGPLRLEVRGLADSNSAIAVTASNDVTVVAASQYPSASVALVPGSGARPFEILNGCAVDSPDRIIPALGDFNGDGQLDILGCLSADPRIVLGDGAAWPGRGVRAISGVANAAALADLDDDGRDDIILVTSGSQQVRVYKGNPAGTISAQPDQTLVLSGTTNSEQLVAADFDGDGDIDVLRIYRLVQGLQTKFMFLENAGGMLSLTPEFDRANFSWVELVDVDQDGAPEVVTLLENSQGPVQLSVYGLNGALSLASPVVTALPSGTVDFALGDVSEDGYPDLVFVVEDRVMMSLGAPGNPGVFGSPIELTSVGAPTRGVHIAQLDGQSGLDIFVSTEWTQDRARGAAVILLRDGAGFRVHKRYVVSFGRAIVDVDWNDDGVQDMIVGGAEVPAVPRFDFLRGLGEGNFWAASLVQLPADLTSSHVLAGDFVPGGSPFDLAVATGHHLRILRRDADEVMTEVADFELTDPTDPLIPQPLFTVAAHDLDGQNGLEILGCGSQYCMLLISQSDGTYAFSRVEPAVGGEVATMLDLTGDGQVELAIGGPPGLQVRPATGGGPLFSLFGSVTRFRFVAGHFDDSGVPQLAARDSLVRWTGSNFVATPLPSMSGTLAAGDTNGDGYDDLVALDVDGALKRLLGGPTGLETTVSVLARASSTLQGTARLLHDINGDGLADLLAGGMYFIARPSGGVFPHSYLWVGGEVCQQLTAVPFYQAAADDLLCTGGAFLRVHRRVE